MFRLILNILIVCIVLGYTSAYASDDMTKSDFTIDLATMDPLWEADNIKGQWWVQILSTLLGSVADLFLFIIPMIAWVSLLFAGYFYIFSAWDSEKVGKAKTIIKWNMVAITMALLSYGIIKLIAELFT